jgi:hypothetical protein
MKIANSKPHFGSICKLEYTITEGNRHEERSYGPGRPFRYRAGRPSGLIYFLAPHVGYLYRNANLASCNNFKSWSYISMFGTARLTRSYFLRWWGDHTKSGECTWAAQFRGQYCNVRWTRDGQQYSQVYTTLVGVSFSSWWSHEPLSASQFVALFFVLELSVVRVPQLLYSPYFGHFVLVCWVGCFLDFDAWKVLLIHIEVSTGIIEVKLRIVPITPRCNPHFKTLIYRLLPWNSVLCERIMRTF